VSKLQLGALALVCPLLTVGCASIGSNGTTPSPEATVSVAPSASVAPVVARRALACHARAANKHPRDHTTVRIEVRTAAHARVAGMDLVSSVNRGGRASAGGDRALQFPVGNSRPGLLVVIEVRTTRNGRTGTCTASFRPLKAQVAPVTSPPAPAPAPPTAASCYPLSDEGTCYEPGEFCRDSDHGATGVAGDGERIECEDNDGWRWEPI
jgi:hypothetical protein